MLDLKYHLTACGHSTDVHVVDVRLAFRNLPIESRHHMSVSNNLESGRPWSGRPDSILLPTNQRAPLPTYLIMGQFQALTEKSALNKVESASIKWMRIPLLIFALAMPRNFNVLLFGILDVY